MIGISKLYQLAFIVFILRTVINRGECGQI